MTARWVESLPDPEGASWAEGASDLTSAAYWLACPTGECVAQRATIPGVSS